MLWGREVQPISSMVRCSADGAIAILDLTEALASSPMVHVGGRS